MSIYRLGKIRKGCGFFDAHDISDQIGRKPTLFICLLGGLIGYALLISAILTHNIILFMLGRILAGFTAGSMSIAQAAIIDVSHAHERTKNLGIMLLAVSVGYVVGPLIAGILSNHSWVSWFSLNTPLYFSSGLTIANILLLLFYFQDSRPEQQVIKINWFSGFFALFSGFREANIRRLSASFLLLQIGWSAYLQSVGIFLTERYHFNATSIGFYMGWTGVGFSVAFCYLLNKLVASYSLTKIAMVALSGMSVMILLLIVIPASWSVWIFSVPAACGLAITYSVLVSLFSQQVDASRQGWVMGLTGAIGAASFGVTALLSGFLANINITLPIWVAIITLVSAVFFLKIPHARDDIRRSGG